MSIPFTPRVLQRKAIEFMLDTPKCALFASMGAGKGSATLATINALNVIEGEKHTFVLAPKRVVTMTWPDEIAKWLDFNHLDTSIITGTAAERRAALRRDRAIHLMNYENVPWLMGELKGKWPFHRVVADECFPAGTHVSTPEGAKDIAAVRVGDLVNTHLGPKRITCVSARTALNLVLLELSNGVSIRVTEDHPFLTDIGWLPARMCGGRRLVRESAVCILRGSISTAASAGRTAGEGGALAVLFPIMSHEGPLSTATRVARAVCRDYANDKSERSHPVERRRPLARRTSRPYVSLCERGRSKAPGAGRERPRDDADGGAISADVAARIYLELRGVVGEEDARLSFLLQTGLCKPRHESWFGGRWGIPPHGPRQDTRHEKNGEVVVVGVVYSPNKKRGRMGVVFNLEVEDAHTFFAEGVLVHNCSKLKSASAKRFKGTPSCPRIVEGGVVVQEKRVALPGLKHIAHLAERWINLTGTPTPNGIEDLWSQVFLLDGGERLGRTITAFRDRWFQRDFNGYGYVPLPHAFGEIMALIKDICLTIDVKDYVDLPPLVMNDIYVDLPPDARRFYRELEREFFAVNKGREVEAVNSAVLSGKLLQAANGAVYASDGEVGEWTPIHDAKLEALEDIIEEASGAPVMIAYHYKHDLIRLKAAHPDARVMDDNPQTLHDWNAGRIPKLLIHPDSAGHGLSMQEGGNILVFFSQISKLESYLQVIERIGPMRQFQSGLDRPCFVHSILARNTYDEIAVARGLRKAATQDAVREYMKRREE